MLRTQLKALAQIRCNSYSSLVQKVASGSPVNCEEVAKALANKSYSSEDLEKLHDLIKCKQLSSETLNELLHHGLPSDFSLYFTMAKNIDDHKWNNKSLISLIQNNPGRVQSLWDLLKKHGSSVSDEVKLAVADKLILGEKAEQREGEVEITGRKLRQAFELLREVGDISKLELQLSHIVDHLAEIGASSAFRLLKVPGFLKWVNLAKLPEIQDRAAFVEIASIVFEHERTLLSKKLMCKVLAASNVSTTNVLALFEEFGEEARELDLAAFQKQILEYIETHKLDLDKNDPEALLLRIQLIETYGMNQDNVQAALEKFHTYQAHEKFGIELVQTKLVQAFCYQAFKHLDETFFKIAETLVPEEMQVKTIAHLILASCQFDIDQSLKMYNDSITRVSNNVNSETGRSASGVLTEALMIANLYDNDREFAQLLFEKAVGNKMVDESEIAILKKVFKVYGEAFEEDSWEKAKPKLHEYVLETIKRM